MNNYRNDYGIRSMVKFECGSSQKRILKIEQVITYDMLNLETTIITIQITFNRRIYSYSLEETPNFEENQGCCRK